MLCYECHLRTMLLFGNTTVILLEILLEILMHFCSSSRSCKNIYQKYLTLTLFNLQNVAGSPKTGSWFPTHFYRFYSRGFAMSTQIRGILSSFTPKRDELQISQSFSQRKMACEIGKKTHLALPAALWWKVRSQPKQSRRLRPAHHPQTHSPNKDRSTAIAVYLGNDRNHHDGEKEKNLFTNPITQRILSFGRSQVESEPGLRWNQSGRYSFLEPIAFLSLVRSRRLPAEVNNHLTRLSCHLYIWIIVFGLWIVCTFVYICQI